MTTTDCVDHHSLTPLLRLGPNSTHTTCTTARRETNKKHRSGLHTHTRTYSSTRLHHIEQSILSIHSLHLSSSSSLSFSFFSSCSSYSSTALHITLHLVCIHYCTPVTTKPEHWDPFSCRRSDTFGYYCVSWTTARKSHPSINWNRASTKPPTPPPPGPTPGPSHLQLVGSTIVVQYNPPSIRQAIQAHWSSSASRIQVYQPTHLLIRHIEVSFGKFACALH